MSVIVFVIIAIIISKLSKVKKTKKYNYFILKDTCIKKVEKNIGSDEESSKYLYFEKSGKCLVNNIHFNPFSVFSLYYLSEEGEDFYLVKNEKNKIRYIYPARECEIDSNSLIKQDDVFYPNK